MGKLKTCRNETTEKAFREFFFLSWKLATIYKVNGFRIHNTNTQQLKKLFVVEFFFMSTYQIVMPYFRSHVKLNRVVSYFQNDLIRFDLNYCVLSSARISISYSVYSLPNNHNNNHNTNKIHKRTEKKKRMKT